MKKKKFLKKLLLSKRLITSLDQGEMNQIKGASVLTPFCSNSCSILYYCCGTTTEPKLEKNDIG